jgi:hypothetical protein
LSFSIFQIEGTILPLELTANDDNTGVKADGISAWTMQVGETNKFIAYASIPKSNIQGNLQIMVVYSPGNEFGIENYKVTARCREPAGTRKLDHDGSMSSPAGEPDSDGEDSSYYCLASDFPCEGGTDVVHVCHYSARLGYQTFCIPEPDSEVLRFYAKDYCGPCIGGFN